MKKPFVKEAEGQDQDRFVFSDLLHCGSGKEKVEEALQGRANEKFRPLQRLDLLLVIGKDPRLLKPSGSDSRYCSKSCVPPARGRYKVMPLLIFYAI